MRILCSTSVILIFSYLSSISEVFVYLSVISMDMNRRGGHCRARMAGERTGSVTWEQPTTLRARQYPFWYRHRAAFGSLIIVNVCIGTYVLFTVKPKPKASKKGKAPSMHSAREETEFPGSREGHRSE